MTNTYKRPIITGREQLRVGKVYAQRFERNPDLPKSEYLARLIVICEELYPAKRYPSNLTR